jgi:hypothetical protein
VTCSAAISSPVIQYAETKVVINATILHVNDLINDLDLETIMAVGLEPLL